MNKVDFQRTLDFAEYMDVGIYEELLQVLQNHVAPKQVFNNSGSDLRGLIQDLYYMDYSAWKLNNSPNKNVIIDEWLSTIQIVHHIFSGDPYDILSCPISFNPRVRLLQTKFYWHSFNYKSSGFLKTILASQGENYVMQRISMFRTIDENPLGEIDLLLLNIREWGSVTGIELLKIINPKNKQVIRDKFVKFLAQHLIYYNTLTLRSKDLKSHVD